MEGRGAGTGEGRLKPHSIDRGTPTMASATHLLLAATGVLRLELMFDDSGLRADLRSNGQERGWADESQEKQERHKASAGAI